MKGATASLKNCGRII